MENTLALGQPIPTGIITPTEILSPDIVATSARQQFEGVAERYEFTHLTALTEVMTAAMVTPIVAWTTVTRSYLRFLGVLDQDGDGA